MISPSHDRKRRGFTLLEVVIGLGISGLVIAGAMTLLVQQQRSYAVTASDRAQQEAGQAALREIVNRLALAGFGIDPNLAFDFGVQALPVPRTGAPTNGVTFGAFSTYLCDTPVTCRDHTDASDEIVFYIRNPLFSRNITSFLGTALSFRGGLTRPIYKGQILQVSCLGGNQARGYVKVVRTVLPTAVPPNPAEVVNVELEPAQVNGFSWVFPFENNVASDGCWGLTTVGETPVVTQVDRYRFYVDWYAEQGTRVVPQTEGARPYLMLDQGLTDQNGVALVSPIATDVEDLQFSYYFRPAAALQDNVLVGATVGINAAMDPNPLTVAVAAPNYTDAPDAVTRTTGHPANILAVRVSVVVRSPDRDVGLITILDRTLPQAGNRAAFQGATYYRRSLFESTVLIRNLRSTAYSYPQVNPAGGAGLNLGGG